MRNRKIATVLKQILCIILCIIVIAPFYMILINSFKTKNEAARMALTLPTTWVFSNYAEVIKKAKLVQGFINSLTYAGVATLVGVICAAMGAYILSRRRNKLTNFLYYFILCGLFFPVNYVTLIKVLSTLQLTNTKIGIILAFTSAMIPFCVFTIYSFVMTVPVELDEAAVIDGAGPVRLFFSIIVPMLKPTLVTCFILQFMTVWSDFLTPLYLSSKSKLFPMTMAVYQFFGKSNNQWQYIFSDIVLTCLPVIIVYLLGQKYIVGGLTSGAVKE